MFISLVIDSQTGYLRATVLFAYVLGGVLGGMNVREDGQTNWGLVFGISQTSVSFGISMFLLACYLSSRTMKRHLTIIPEASAPVVDSSSTVDIGCSSRRANSGGCLAILEASFMELNKLRRLLRSIYSSRTVLIWSCW
jgi:hypothetical protein